MDGPHVESVKGSDSQWVKSNRPKTIADAQWFAAFSTTAVEIPAEVTHPQNIRQWQWQWQREPHPFPYLLPSRFAMVALPDWGVNRGMNVVEFCSINQSNYTDTALKINNLRAPYRHHLSDKRHHLPGIPAGILCSPHDLRAKLAITLAAPARQPESSC
jgi:hypothetical protein